MLGKADRQSRGIDVGGLTRIMPHVVRASVGEARLNRSETCGLPKTTELSDVTQLDYTASPIEEFNVVELTPIK